MAGDYDCPASGGVAVRLEDEELEDGRIVVCRACGRKHRLRHVPLSNVTPNFTYVWELVEDDALS